MHAAPASEGNRAVGVERPSLPVARASRSPSTRLLGSGPLPGPPRQADLGARASAGGPGGGLLGSPGSTVGGMATATARGPAPAHGTLPSRCLSAPAGGILALTVTCAAHFS